jgi:hypothetical protein
MREDPPLVCDGGNKDRPSLIPAYPTDHRNPTGPLEVEGSPVGCGRSGLRPYYSPIDWSRHPNVTPDIC